MVIDKVRVATAGCDRIRFDFPRFFPIVDSVGFRFFV